MVCLPKAHLATLCSSSVCSRCCLLLKNIKYFTSVLLLRGETEGNRGTELSQCSPLLLSVLQVVECMKVFFFFFLVKKIYKGYSVYG